MKNCSKNIHPLRATIILLSLFLTGCATNWGLNPRDRSIKKWEKRENKTNTTKKSTSGISLNDTSCYAMCTKPDSAL